MTPPRCAMTWATAGPRGWLGARWGQEVSGSVWGVRALLRLFSAYGVAGAACRAAGLHL